MQFSRIVRTVIALCLTLAGSSAAAQTVTVYDLASECEWSDVPNKEGIASFGTWTLKKSESAPFTTNLQWATDIRAWADAACCEPEAHVPLFARLATDAQPELQAGDIYTHTAELDRTGTATTSVVWTAPSAGLATVEGALWSLGDDRDVLWQLTLNGTVLSEGELGPFDWHTRTFPMGLSEGWGGVYATKQSVQEGDTLALVLISLSEGGNLGRSLGLQLKITHDGPVKLQDVAKWSQGGTWGHDHYDDHEKGKFGDKDDGEMGEWGCATTALAMALSYALGPEYNPPQYDTVTPGALNTFMSQDVPVTHSKSIWKGYSTHIPEQLKSGGDVLFPETIAEYSAAHPELKNKLKFYPPPSYPPPSVGSQDPEVIRTALRNGYPVIVKLDGSSPSGMHFVVVTGFEGDTFFVNDPAGDITELPPNFEIKGVVASKSPFECGADRLVSSAVTVPDLGALSVVAGDGLEMLLADPDGRRVGYDGQLDTDVADVPNASYERQAIEDDEGNGFVLDTMHHLFASAPESGLYNVDLFGTQVAPYELAVRTWDSNGDPQSVAVVTGVVTPGLVTSFDLEVDTAPGSTGVVTRVASFANMIEEIEASLDLGLITNQGWANSLTKKLESASSDAEKGKLESSRNVLAAFQNELVAQEGKKIDSFAVEFLFAEAGALIEQLGG